MVSSSVFNPTLIFRTRNSSASRTFCFVISGVVKVFNTVGHAHMFRPSFPGGPPDMFICGDDEGAKRQVEALLRDLGEQLQIIEIPKPEQTKSKSTPNTKPKENFPVSLLLRVMLRKHYTGQVLH
jgi:hypothetical protein